MGRGKKQAEAEGEPGVPEWMLTFSDCMTLLLTFFVLLMSFSSFDDKVVRRWKSIFAQRFSFDEKSTIDKDAFLPTEVIQQTDDDIEKGSEKPTLEKGTENNLERETEPSAFRNRKIFLISSDKIFYGNGTIISLQGRRILATMALFLREIPARIVISENGQGSSENEEYIGMNRAWAVIEYMTKKQSLDKQQFSISAAGTTMTGADANPANSEMRDVENTKAERLLEIVLLERSIYN